MRKVWMPLLCGMAALSLSAGSATASAKTPKALQLREEGVELAVGAEVKLKLAVPGCRTPTARHQG